MGCLITLICIIVGGWIIGGISAYRNYKNRPKFPKYDPKPWRKAPWPELNPLCMHCGESACQVTKESQRQVSNPYGPPDVKMFCDVICTSCGKLNTTGNAHTIDPKKRAKWDAIERHWQDLVMEELECSDKTFTKMKLEALDRGLVKPDGLLSKRSTLFIPSDDALSESNRMNGIVAKIAMAKKNLGKS